MAKYDHGRKTSKEVYEMSPLEAAIQRYEEETEKYHKARSKTFTSDEQRKDHEEQLAKQRAHLDLERMAILSQAQVQRQLDEYREKARKKDDATQEQLENEEYHPNAHISPLYGC